MNSAVDHGYAADWSVKVEAGLEFRHLSAEGNSRMRVLRAHRDVGYWECVWLDGPRERGIWIRGEKDILADCRAP
jgi:hypothetical protein